MFRRSMQIPRFGFTIETRKKAIRRDTAYAVITAHQQKITCAEQEDHAIAITKHTFVCPYCRKEMPAYKEYLTKKPERTSIKPLSVIAEWTSGQLSLFGELPKILPLNTPIKSLNKFVCPRCNAVSHPSKGTVKVSISVKKKAITISRRLDMEDIFDIAWFDGDITLFNLELYETIAFNLKNGHTFVKLEDCYGNRLKIRDISNMNIETWHKDPIIALLNGCKPVFRELKRQFIQIWKEPLPFSQKELSPKYYILLTRFVGYKAEFYQSIPYAAEKYLIEKRFLKTAEKLHTARRIPMLFEKAQLPNTKSIRKIFFENPALLFYTKELELFWQIIGDVNLFRDFIQSAYLFRELMRLCRMPSLIGFYRDYQSVFGAKSLLKRFAAEGFRPREWQCYATAYLALSPYDQKAERQKWINVFPLDQNIYSRETMGAWFSVPLPPERINAEEYPFLESTVKGYSFQRLHNSADYWKAGTELHNCLIDWKEFHGNVYGIREKGKYVGAVEVEDGEIKQAFAQCNDDIESDPKLFAAFHAWKTNNLLKDEGEGEGR